MDKHHHDHHDSGFFGGFLLGAIIGAAVVFFLFTDKGKALLRKITEEGFEGFSDFKDLIQEEMDSYEDDEYEDNEKEPRHLAPIPHKVAYSHAEPQHHDHHEEDHNHEYEEDYSHYAPAPSRVKRFFRGVKR